MIDEAGVVAKFGVPPASIPDYLALVGDSADGFPGLPGWGAKSAAAVLARYGHIEDDPRRLAVEWDVDGARRDRLAATLAEHASAGRAVPNPRDTAHRRPRSARSTTGAGRGRRPSSRRGRTDSGSPRWWPGPRSSRPTAERARIVGSRERTDGSRGTGRAGHRRQPRHRCGDRACGLAADGADVAVNYRRGEDTAQENVQEIAALGRRAGAYQASVDDLDADAAMVEAVLADFGHIDLFVHSAGIASRGQTVADTDPEEIERVWRVHALGAFMLSKLVLPSMRDAGARRHRLHLERGDAVHGRVVVAVQHGEGVARGTGTNPRQGGAQPRHPRERRGARSRRHRDGPAARAGRPWA